MPCQVYLQANVPSLSSGRSPIPGDEAALALHPQESLPPPAREPATHHSALTPCAHEKKRPTVDLEIEIWQLEANISVLQVSKNRQLLLVLVRNVVLQSVLNIKETREVPSLLKLLPFPWCHYWQTTILLLEAFPYEERNGCLHINILFFSCFWSWDFGLWFGLYFYFKLKFSPVPL